MTQEQRIQNALDRIAQTRPNLAFTVLNLKFKETKSIPTLAVDFHGHGLFNGDFVADLSSEELNFVLLHELSHVTLKHIKRFLALENISYRDFLTSKERDLRKKFRIYNIAADTIINENITATSPDCQAPDACYDRETIKDEFGITFTDEQFGQLTTEQLFEMLENAEETTGGESSSSDDNQTIDNEQQQQGDGRKKDLEEIAKEFNTDQSNDEDKDSNNTDDTRDNNIEKFGNLPLSDSNELGKVLTPKATVINAEKLAKEIRNSASSIATQGTRKYSYRRPNRRYRKIYPYSKGDIKTSPKDIVLSIDVSGSIEDDDVNAIVSLVNELAKHYNLSFYYGFFNTTTTELERYTTQDKFVSDMENVKGGGTSWCAAKDEKITAGCHTLIIVSDMNFDTPEREILDDIKAAPYKTILADISRLANAPILSTFDKYFSLF